jgi:hypothetical protein
MNITETNIFETLMADQTLPTRDENGKFLPKAVKEEMMMELTRKLVKTMSRATEVDFRMFGETRISKQANGTFVVEGAESNAAALREIIEELTEGEITAEELKEAKMTTRQLGGKVWNMIKTELQKRKEEAEAKALAEAEKVVQAVEVVEAVEAVEQEEA